MYLEKHSFRTGKDTKGAIQEVIIKIININIHFICALKFSRYLYNYLIYPVTYKAGKGIFYCTNKKNEAWTSEITCLRSHSY